MSVRRWKKTGMRERFLAQRGVDRGGNELFASATLCDQDAIWVCYGALTDIAFVSTAHAYHEHLILDRARREQRMPLLGLGIARDPSGWIDEDVAPRERCRTGLLGETQIVADREADLAERRIDRLEERTTR